VGTGEKIRKERFFEEATEGKGKKQPLPLGGKGGTIKEPESMN